MALRIEDYALLGDMRAAALVGRDGSVDWLCAPRFDSDACFAALLGDERHGRFLVAPEGGARAARRRYRPGSLVLETTFEAAGGEVRVVDAMPPGPDGPALVRLVEGVRGEVPMVAHLAARFGTGKIVPWVRCVGGAVTSIAGPDAISLRAEVPLTIEEDAAWSTFRVAAGQRTALVARWHHAHEPPPAPLDATAAIGATDDHWKRWSARCTHEGDHREAVVRSLITLKALGYTHSGGIVAAPTTSLPERIGGARNWDYRYCWLRDATFTLIALVDAGYGEEASAFRDWLLRAVAGEPSALQVMYGPLGERRLDEREADWLPGYEGSRPVHIGNGAAKQLQLDVYGEVLDAAYQARRRGLEGDPAFWDLQRALLDYLEGNWRRPDSGIWEMRGPPRDFTHSKVMAWAAMDRAIAEVERFGMKGPVDRWRAVRAEIHDEVCRRGFDPGRNAFVQAYGETALDAAVLLVPLVGFLPADDPRVSGTVEAIERELMEGGFVLRYRTEAARDGFPPGEGAFLACSFWLADVLWMQGRRDDARALFERLLAVRNDVGLLSEEYDAGARRLVGNFPQAFSHVALVNTAARLAAGRASRAAPDVEPASRQTSG
jgi:GH15 family glucan-1,4-alpha-glucosidase